MPSTTHPHAFHFATPVDSYWEASADPLNAATPPFTGNETWNLIPTSGGELYQWQESSTYIQEPPFFAGLAREVKPITNIKGARVLVKVGDYLIVPSLYMTCLRTTGSYFFISSLSGVVRLFLSVV